MPRMQSLEFRLGNRAYASEIVLQNEGTVAVKRGPNPYVLISYSLRKILLPR